MIEGFIRMMELSRDPGPVNLGNPEELTVREIADLVLQLSGSSSSLDYRSLPSDDPTRRRPDITKARRVLGWEPRVSAADGIAETIEYYRAAMPAHSGNGHRTTGHSAPVLQPD
jgi:nucleoside-diphosphate-sugar epimerase